MKPTACYSLACWSIVALLAVVSPVGAEELAPAATPFVLTNTPASPNGGWCWYQDERAIVDTAAADDPLLLVSSVSAGEAAERGDIDLHWRNLRTGEQGTFELDDQLEQDDHNVAALYLRPDGRYLALWARHNSDRKTYWRVSENPHDPTAWGPINTINNGAGTTYNNVYYLPGDRNGEGRLYNFTRARNFDPNVQVSYDQGTTWQYAGKLMTEGGGGDRPYVRYAGDGKRIHLMTTERHPRNFANSIFHGYVADGTLFDSHGDMIDSSILDDQGEAPAKVTCVFRNGSTYDGLVMNRAWTTSLELDAEGLPVGVFTARVNDSNEDHRFFYAKFDGTQWQVHHMAEAGGYLYLREDDYTGLAAIDPDDTSVVYLSTDVDPRSGDETEHYEIYRGKTSDIGATWQWSAITENSAVDNLRPIVPAYHRDQTVLLWLQGDFSTYTEYATEVVGLVLDE
ncbi:BNR-4 repeat-containing protein [Aeoliella mucimassa]|uniref:BNR/Asp-box repeat protein n=1 Tax=Aeoliella mucimassa TaxID=2527972 RepID=A0A518AJ92_9BACT|nr:BNR-4 repeat-containing protein [Aeoliella mucimassa]QDU54795.1 hypothetical protein Pan181_09780 [Aeoliella mucimassa]